MPKQTQFSWVRRWLASPSRFCLAQSRINPDPAGPARCWRQDCGRSVSQYLPAQAASMPSSGKRFGRTRATIGWRDATETPKLASVRTSGARVTTDTLRLLKYHHCGPERGRRMAPFGCPVRSRRGRTAAFPIIATMSAAAAQPPIARVKPVGASSGPVRGARPGGGAGAIVRRGRAPGASRISRARQRRGGLDAALDRQVFFLALRRSAIHSAGAPVISPSPRAAQRASLMSAPAICAPR